MITAAENRPWPGDIKLTDHAAAGLPIPSVVRTSKIATIVARRAQRRGTLPPGEMAAVDAEIAAGLKVHRQGGFHE